MASTYVEYLRFRSCQQQNLSSCQWDLYHLMQHPCGPVCFRTAAACPLSVNGEARSRHRLAVRWRSFPRSPSAEFAGPCLVPSLGSGRCPWCWSLPLPPGDATVYWKAAISSSGRCRSCCPSSACTDPRLPRSGGSHFGSRTTRKLRHCLQNRRNKSNTKHKWSNKWKQLNLEIDLQLWIFWRFLRWFTVSSRISAFSSLRFRI